MALAVIFSVQKMCHYIVANHTQVVADSNPMWYLLSLHLLQGYMSKWVIILQEFNWEFVSPKITKELVLAALMTELPPFSTPPPPKDNLPDEFLFIIYMEDQ